nr:ATP-binding protein [Kofleriaceae bacterium]
MERVLAGGGAAGELARRVDWAATPIGPVDTWSRALRSTAALVLHNHCPMLLWWGPEFVQIYNDAYRPVLGDHHPRAMGQRTRDCWSEIWHLLEPMIESPFRGGPATTNDDFAVALRRKSFLEEAHFLVAYSPVPDETVATGVGGVLATVTETTEQVYAERQMRLLSELASRGAAGSDSAERACENAAGVLATDPWDVPYALVFLFDDAGAARLVASAGFADRAAAQLAADVCAWAGRVTATEVAITACSDALPASPWHERPREAIAIPLASPDHADPYGVLVCGVSPHRVLDAGYRAFFELATGQVVTAIRNARALEHERRRGEALAALDRAKTAFFSNVSHEFRTPLTLMLGPTDDALRSPERALVGDALEAVHRNALRLLKLVNGLLDFSRIEAGRMQAAYEPTDLAARTRDLGSVFRAAIERSGLKLRVELASLDEPIFVDVDMWEKIVLNLLSNALKFTFHGEIAMALEDRGDAVALTVRDTGTGVPASELPRIFDRFHRVEGAAARTHEGTGIGLALVRDLVELHGGAVDVVSEVGAGTAFTVTIPKGSQHLDPARVIARATRTGAGPVRDTAMAEAFAGEATRWQPPDEPIAPASLVAAVITPRPRVLVADDNADMRDYLARLLAPTCDVELAGDGAAALASALATPPDLVLSDVMMPELDGVELVAELRRHPATHAVPVVLLSARAGEDSQVEGLDAGADDYLVKPFSARELLARVRSQLELARGRRLAASRLARLNRVTTALSAAAAPEAIARAAVTLGVEALDAQLAAMWFVDAAARELVLADAVAMAPELRAAAARMPLDGDTTVARAARTGEPSYVSRAEEVPRGVGRLPTTDRYRSRFVMPIAVAGEVVAVMGVSYTDWRTFGDDDRVVADALTTALAGSFERARLYARETAARHVAEAAQQRASFLADASAILGSSLDFETTLASVARLAVPTIADWCTVELAPDVAPHASPVVACAVPDDRELADVYRSRGRRTAGGPARVERRGAITCVAVPMASRGRVLGTLGLCSGTAHRAIDSDDLRMAEELGRRAGVAIDNALLYRDARAADRRKDEFLAILGHELRNPLAPIVTALELGALHGSIDDRNRAVMERQLRHMVRLVDDLLDVSRIARGKIDIDKRAMPLADALDQAVEMARPQFERKQMTLAYDRGGTDHVVMGDVVRLVQVFGNVLANAARYTQTGGHVAVACRADHRRATVTVRDDGSGIAPEVLPRIFELFEQGQRAATSQAGLGIGLAICRSLVELHGGTIAATSLGVGRGSEFAIELPLWLGSGSDPAIVRPPALDDAPRARNVLVVDDNADAAELLADVLGVHGYEVTISHDGEGALDAVAARTPDIVLLDIGLPDIDGYEVARRIRALGLGKSPHVVALSGYGQSSDRERSAASGFDAHLVKPVDIRQLLGMLALARQADR